MKDGKVISFPRIKKDSPPQSLEDIQNNVLKVRMENVNRLTEELATTFLSMIDSQGIDVTDPKFMKMNALMIELTKAYICRSMDIEHVLIDMAETCFNCSDDGEMFKYEYDFSKTEE